MGKWTADRWAAASGIGFVVLLVVAGLISGSPKAYDKSAADITSYLQDKHKELLIGALLLGVAYVLFLWFVASFAGAFREAGQRRLSTVMYGAGIALVAVAAVADGINVALARSVSLGANAATVKTIYGVDVFVYNRVYWLAAALALATAIAVGRTNVLPAWFGWLSYFGAAVFAVAGASMKTSGFFSPSGGMPFLAVLLFLVWILLASVLLVQRTSEAAAPRAATVM